MSYSKAIYNAVVRFLEDDDWKYTFDAEKELIRAGVTLKNKLQSCKILVDLRDDRYSVFATINLNVEQGARDEMAKLINYINYDIMFGFFEMDYRDGEIRFRMPVNCADAMPSQEVIRHSIYVPALMMDKYGDALLKVMMGFAYAKDAFDAVED